LAAHAIALCCRGLLAHLLQLRACSGAGAAEVPLRVALAQSLQCPLVDPRSRHARAALLHCRLPPRGGGAAAPHAGRDSGGDGGARLEPAADWPRPVWVEGGGGGSADDSDAGAGAPCSHALLGAATCFSFGGRGDEGGNGGAATALSVPLPVRSSLLLAAPAEEQRPLWTVREVGGQSVVVRRPRPRSPASRRGYWNSADNVQRELRCAVGGCRGLGAPAGGPAQLLGPAVANRAPPPTQSLLL
jgi:hypothetical protein